MIGRLLGRVLSALALVVLSPVLAVAAVVIKRASPGPVLYRAARVGRGGAPFTMLKLRTMHVGSSAGGTITGSADPRVFGAGEVLRRYKIDELPQLVNVLRGEMALVGPRPEDVAIVRDHYDALMRESLVVAPGLTSPGSLHYFAQEDSLPSDPAEAERVYLDEVLPLKIALDLVWVRNRTRAYTAELVVRTVLGIVGGSGLFASRRTWELAEAGRLLAERAP